MKGERNERKCMRACVRACDRACVSVCVCKLYGRFLKCTLHVRRVNEARVWCRQRHAAGFEPVSTDACDHAVSVSKEYRTKDALRCERRRGYVWRMRT